MTQTRTKVADEVGAGAACTTEALTQTDVACDNTSVVCPVDCQYSAWTDGECSVTCGGAGTMTQTREKTADEVGAGAACTTAALTQDGVACDNTSVECPDSSDAVRVG